MRVAALPSFGCLGDSDRKHYRARHFCRGGVPVGGVDDSASHRPPPPPPPKGAAGSAGRGVCGSGPSWWWEGRAVRWWRPTPPVIPYSSPLPPLPPHAPALRRTAPSVVRRFYGRRSGRGDRGGRRRIGGGRGRCWRSAWRPAVMTGAGLGRWARGPTTRGALRHLRRRHRCVPWRRSDGARRRQGGAVAAAAYGASPAVVGGVATVAYTRAATARSVLAVGGPPSPCDCLQQEGAGRLIREQEGGDRPTRRRDQSWSPTLVAAHCHCGDLHRLCAVGGIGQPKRAAAAGTTAAAAAATGATAAGARSGRGRPPPVGDHRPHRPR